jgi:hypothetical protein
MMFRHSCTDIVIGCEAPCTVHRAPCPMPDPCPSTMASRTCQADHVTEPPFREKLHPSIHPFVGLVRAADGVVHRKPKIAFLRHLVLHHHAKKLSMPCHSIMHHHVKKRKCPPANSSSTTTATSSPSTLHLNITSSRAAIATTSATLSTLWLP